MPKTGFSDGSILVRAESRFDYTRCPVCQREVQHGHIPEVHQVAALERIATALEVLGRAAVEEDAPE